jgi:hypothetical protein
MGSRVFRLFITIFPLFAAGGAAHTYYLATDGNDSHNPQTTIQFEVWNY